MEPSVRIDCYPPAAEGRERDDAVVAIDVIRAATTVVTAVALGRRCFPAPSVDAALRLRDRLGDVLLAGEERGVKPTGFAVDNSPAALAARADVTRPLVLLSSSGTKLMHALRSTPAAYVACFRNAAAVARHLAGRHPRVVLIAATSRGEFREEDQICTAWIARALMQAGHRVEDQLTADVIERWGDTPASGCARGRSAEFLRRSGQHADLDFVLGHVNDLDTVFAVRNEEVVELLPPFAWPEARVAGGGVAPRV